MIYFDNLYDPLPIKKVTYMFLPNPTIDIRFYSHLERREIADKIIAANTEGVIEVTFSDSQEEYWPGKFSTILTLHIHLDPAANLLSVRSELEKI